MLITAIILPFIGAIGLALWPRWSTTAARWFATTIAGIPLLLLIFAWCRFDTAGPLFQFVTDLPWIPALDAGLRFGADGISLAVSTMSALLFTIAGIYPVDFRGKARQYLAWMLFLESVCLALFLTLDLLVFYVCFDLSLVGMYFLIAVWGHDDRHYAALKFIIYTLAGSLVMLIGFLSLILGSDPVTFDMRVLIEQQPLAGTGTRASLTLLAILFGLAIKTPLVPFHTWLPIAHVEAPAPASMILAGVLLKMGTYGMIRIACSMFRETFTTFSFWIGVIAVVSIVYGAMVALGQGHIKRRIAYTSVTHMGYTVLGIAMAFPAGKAVSEAAQRMALTGASLEMLAHGLITGALFLCAGSIWQRTHSYEMDDHAGIARHAPRLTVLFIILAFASLGLPGLAGFIAEFQIFAGSLAIEPWLVAIALLGVLVTAALFLQLLQKCFFGKPGGRVTEMGDIGTVETLSLSVLSGLTIIIGVAPAFVVNLLEATSRLLVGGP